MYGSSIGVMSHKCTSCTIVSCFNYEMWNQVWVETGQKRQNMNVITWRKKFGRGSVWGSGGSVWSLRGSGEVC